MQKTTPSRVPMVQIVGPTDGWILEKLARQLARKLPYSKFQPWKPVRPTEGQIIYYVNYALYEESTGGIDVGFFTHFDRDRQFLERARQMQHCVSMSQLYATELCRQGIDAVTHIPMGFDFYRFRPKLSLAVVGLLDHPRKGRALFEKVRELTFVEIVASQGALNDDQLLELYQRADFVIILSTVEGGPMCLLEAMAVGTPVIAPRSVGMVPEFPPGPHLRMYDAGDWNSLRSLLEQCYREKLSSRSLVSNRTWDDWAQSHHRLFSTLLEQRGFSLRKPHQAFRWGIMRLVECPPNFNCAIFEQQVDAFASHLYFGEIDDARLILNQLRKDFPFAERLSHLTG